MAVSKSFLDNILSQNVCELKFVRRNPKTGAALSRRMLGTTNFNVLNSEIGKGVFGFQVPRFQHPYNRADYNLSFMFDIFRLDWRNIPCESVVLVKIFPATNPTLINEWWKTFKSDILPLTAQQKLEFMDK